ncbi:hypothetical protein [Fischerella sp. PCC 9605]|uniref:hypothetical protein n=1 Tax=Fischerella sp. PCC 9605 TaxID=1173024 RepID=UPI00047DC74C|nr:hypothetical protein [Fischerella sp. PCC 9605]
MKLPALFNIVPSVLALATILVLANANFVRAENVKIEPNFKPDPIVLNGESGGSKTSDCGNIALTPNQTLEVTESLPYLRLAVEGNGKPTLLIDGPGGRFCVLPDSYSGGKPEMSGFWQKGNYSLYIGELSQGQYTYTLSISQQKKN